ncbi:MAG TPA: phosphoribosyltransferase family protein [Patescibacteria group bacterium]
MAEIFKDRFDAGKQLSYLLKDYKDKDAILIAIPRGGVAVALPVQKELNIPWEVVVARKVGDPANHELGIGAISEKGIVILDTRLIKELGISEEEVGKEINEEKKELERRVDLYRKGKDLPYLKGKIAIVVDDGVARGVTSLAAILSVKKLNPDLIIFACPVCALDAKIKIEKEADEVVCIASPKSFKNIGEFYHDFSAITDDQVLLLLNYK